MLWLIVQSCSKTKTEKFLLEDVFWMLAKASTLHTTGLWAEFNKNSCKSCTASFFFILLLSQTSAQQEGHSNIQKEITKRSDGCSVNPFWVDVFLPTSRGTWIYQRGSQSPFFFYLFIFYIGLLLSLVLLLPRHTK